jgi:hypothetical protein
MVVVKYRSDVSGIGLLALALGWEGYMGELKVLKKEGDVFADDVIRGTLTSDPLQSALDQ